MHASNRSISKDESKRSAELTVGAILLGVVLSIVMGAANVYLGLRVGMTVSASIPAAVVAMGILRGLLRRRSILEANLVQTAASAGESLAAGIIFTMPAMLLVGAWESFHFWTTTLIAMAGGTLGILLMIPMRRVFIVEDQELKYPEALACAEVLRAGGAEAEITARGNARSTGLSLILGGIILGAAIKLSQSLLGLLQGSVEWAVALKGRVVTVGADIAPALVAVGYIVGLPIAVQIFLGGAIGWLVAIPLLSAGLLDANSSSSQAAADVAWQLWDSHVRYLGVGAMIVGGIVSIWRVRNGLRAAVAEMFALANTRGEQRQVEATERNLGGGAIAICGLACLLLVTTIYFMLLQRSVGLTLLTTAIMLVMSFFFAAVASYIVGLVGNSNSPVSGMTITAVLVTGMLVYLLGFSGTEAIVATLGVAGIVCCVACTSGDVCNDLKTGHLVGASPRNQQLMQILGVVVAAFIMAPVMTVLHHGSLNRGTGGIGGEELVAPQAGLFASLTQGFFGEGELPHDMVAWGAAIGFGLFVIDWLLQRAGVNFRLHVMPVAVGIYLPFGLSTPILFGGLVRALVDRRAGESGAQRGVLFTSGIIAGESLLGVAAGFYFYMEGTEGTLGATLLTALGATTSTQQATLLGWASLAVLVGVGWMVYAISARTGSARQ